MAGRKPIGRAEWETGPSDRMPLGCCAGCMLATMLAAFAWAAVLVAVGLAVRSIAG